MTEPRASVLFFRLFASSYPYLSDHALLLSDSGVSMFEGSARLCGASCSEFLTRITRPNES